MDKKPRGRPAPRPDTVELGDMRQAIMLMTQRRRDEILSRIVVKRGKPA